MLSSTGVLPWTNESFHDPISVIRTNNNITEDTFVFSVVRNPYTRVYSYYQFFKKVNHIDIPFIQLLRYVNNISANYVVLTTQNTQHIDRITHYKLFKSDQTALLMDRDGKINLNKIYTFENLHELETDFNVELPALNAGDYSPVDYYKDYDNTAKTLVQQLYKRDFVKFGYSMSFDKSRS